MTNTDVSAPDGEALSVDEAAALLVGTEADDEAAASGLGEDDEADGAPDDEPEGPDEDGEEIRPPHSWDAEAKARFRELPGDVQALISEREGARDRATSMAMQEAAEARRRAEGEASEAMQMSQALDALIPQAAETFASRWDAVDWEAWAAQDPQAAMKARIAFEAEREQLSQLGVAQRQAAVINHQRFVAREAEQLRVVSPELADPKAGPGRRAEVARFLTALGATADQLAALSAEEAGIAYDALQWRKAKSGLSSRSPGGQAPRPTVRPTAAQAERPAYRRASEALAKLTRSGSVDDAVAYLRQRGDR